MDIETLKKMVYVALGYAAADPDQIRKMKKQLADTGKIPEEEGHLIVDEMIAKFKSAKDEVENNIKKVAKGVVEKLNSAHISALTRLGKRIEVLEKERVKKMKNFWGIDNGVKNGTDTKVKSKTKSKGKSAAKKKKSVAAKPAVRKSPAKKSTVKKAGAAKR